MTEQVKKDICAYWDVANIQPSERKKLATPANPSLNEHIFFLRNLDKTLNETSVRAAIARAVPDVTARTMKKRASAEARNMRKLSDIITNECFMEELKYWFVDNHVITKDEYDKWHHAVCLKVQVILNRTYCQKNGDSVPYGKAQKVVNMSIKNMYCLLGAEDIEERFEFCHMPLDSYILKWVCEQLKNKQTLQCGKFCVSKVPAWSNLVYDENGMHIENGKYTYNFFVEEIRNLCQDATPLQKEFPVWREMINK